MIVHNLAFKQNGGIFLIQIENIVKTSHLFYGYFYDVMVHICDLNSKSKGNLRQNLFKQIIFMIYIVFYVNLFYMRLIHLLFTSNVLIRYKIIYS